MTKSELQKTNRVKWKEWGLSDLWWRKYVVKTLFESSSEGTVITFYDKWGAMIAIHEPFDEVTCFYLDEEDYLDSIH